MFYTLPSLPLLCVFGLDSLVNATFYYPTPQASLLEHILVDTHGEYSSGFADAITPCSNYVSGAQTFGRETAAQWLRVAFHDFVTAHVADGTGGIDASIGFETLREENSGSAFNDSFGFFRPYVNSKISMADLVAISVTMGVGNCGGAQIPVRGGRIDAIEGGPFGVPAPETDLVTTLQYFANAGFNQADSIKLTACGHTMGSVHHGGFPTVVGPEAVTPNNTAGGIHFDQTVDVFDPLVVHEYLNWTGQQGGPLVTSFNVSSQSDLRLYESDNNATMIELGNQGEAFVDICVVFLQRMIETVPNHMVLSDVISPLKVKPINATLDFDSHGNLLFTGFIRILTPLSSTPLTSLRLLTSVSLIPLPLVASKKTGYSVFGTTTFFPFTITITDPSSFHDFTVLLLSLPPMAFPVQSRAFVIPSLTAISSTETSTTVDFTVAVSIIEYGKRRSKRHTAPRVKIQAPVEQLGTLGPRILTFEEVELSQKGTKAGYGIWAGSLDIGSIVTGAVSVAVLNESGEEIDIGFF